MEKKINLIYLLGHSRSGSTVLCMHLGLQHNIFYTGELKKFNISYRQRVCTCGEPAEACPFWGQIIAEEKPYFSKPVEKDDGVNKTIKSLKAILFGIGKKKRRKEYNFISNLRRKVESELGHEIFILDSSKSLSRLIMYRQMENVNVQIIYMERDMRANIASFVKRGEGLLQSYWRIRLNKILMKWYLSSKKLDFYNTTLEEFIEHPTTIVDEILSKFNIDNKIDNNKEIHLISGNRKTRFNSTSSNYKIDKSVNQQDPFSPRQKRMLKWLGL